VKRATRGDDVDDWDGDGEGGGVEDEELRCDDFDDGFVEILFDLAAAGEGGAGSGERGAFERGADCDLFKSRGGAAEADADLLQLHRAVEERHSSLRAPHLRDVD
jgi:hypothetical protein